MEEAFNDFNAIHQMKEEKIEELELQHSIAQDSQCLFTLRKAVQSNMENPQVCKEVIEALSKQLGEGKKQENNVIEYTENVFSKEDFYLYRGVIRFYSLLFQDAIADFEQCIKIKKDIKSFYNEGEEEKSLNSSTETDLSDIGLCSVNIHEYQYNLILCYILVIVDLYIDYRPKISRLHWKNVGN